MEDPSCCARRGITSEREVFISYGALNNDDNRSGTASSTPTTSPTSIVSKVSYHSFRRTTNR